MRHRAAGGGGPGCCGDGKGLELLPGARWLGRCMGPEGSRTGVVSGVGLEEVTGQGWVVELTVLSYRGG